MIELLKAPTRGVDGELNMAGFAYIKIKGAFMFSLRHYALHQHGAFVSVYPKNSSHSRVPIKKRGRPVERVEFVLSLVRAIEEERTAGKRRATQEAVAENLGCTVRNLRARLQSHQIDWSRFAEECWKSTPKDWPIVMENSKSKGNKKKVI